MHAAPAEKKWQIVLRRIKPDQEWQLNTKKEVRRQTEKNKKPKKPQEKKYPS